MLLRANRRTRMKNLAKRRKRRLYAQLQAQLEEDVAPEEVERIAMEAEEARQVCHETWLRATAAADAKFKKKQRILEERRLLMDDIKQQMEQESLEKEMQEKEEREAMALARESKRQMELKAWAENIQNLSDEQKKSILCSFHTRTGVCRFGDLCSRVHAPPPTSGRFVLFPGMHTIGVKSHQDGDDHLELDELEMRRAYRAFFLDAIQEFLKLGHVVQLHTCCNIAPHLRGNVYVEYQTAEMAAAAQAALRGRWYAGKQLLSEITHIKSWADAICGLFVRQRCVRGGDCNFLHPFANPVEVDPPPLRYRSPSVNSTQFREGQAAERHSKSNDDKKSQKRHRRGNIDSEEEEGRHHRRRRDERPDKSKRRRRSRSSDHSDSKRGVAHSSRRSHRDHDPPSTRRRSRCLDR
ncbi:hypothetical protein, variant 1 [Aphanomyces invadans]|uniref:C3H1-type domain-containing protein n=1 Tax=Aphanomyces invadans TaxID=157072 RepID=A0A024UWG7_9STRA|nr:hypothetical protein, variant 1 [Aphanomyces invadans]ETW10310.1 hypothetical protein, variant 1 [Aphanomyces invadans]|eukprot:XP_008861725.1 hypothetical protein, variant 1 [Aphanomyces invadans]